MAGVKTLEPGEGLVGLRVDPANPKSCEVVFWPPQNDLWKPVDVPQTAPLASVLPQSGGAGTLVPVGIRLWDAEGNDSTPFLQYQLPGATNWQDAAIAFLDGAAYTPAKKAPALPTGSDYRLIWNAGAVFTTPGPTNVWFCVRAHDVTLVGDWSQAVSYSLMVTADTDGDGMPDKWEVDHGLNPLGNDANNDPDHDGFTNLQEYLADTDPQERNSYLRITGSSLLPGGLKLDWQGGVQATQYLQRNLELGGTNVWLDLLTNLPPTPISGSYTDWLATNVFQFYRMKVER